MEFLHFLKTPFTAPFIIVAFTAFIAYIFQRFFDRFILKSSLVLRSDPTRYKFLKHTLTAIIYLVGVGNAIYSIEPLRILSNSLLTGAGILAAAVGFASQSALSNIISGVFIIIFKPYSINDQIIVKDTLEGVVEDITLRHTVIRDFQNRRIVMPNTMVNDQIIINSNLVDNKSSRPLDFGISYESDVKKAKEIIEQEILKHPLRIDNRTPRQKKDGSPEVVVRLNRLDESSVNIRAWTWAANSDNAYVMYCDLLESIKERFKAEGIDIPYPHRTVAFKNEPAARSDES